MNDHRPVTLLVISSVFAASAGLLAARAQDAAKPDPMLAAIFAPLPAAMDAADNPGTPEKIDLGKKLYFDPRLSKSQEISCNSCHNLATFGVDNKQFSSGHKGQLGGRNSPSVYNAALHFAQFWDGREPTVEAQAKGPVGNPVEMAMPGGDQVVKVLKSIPDYVAAFAKAFPGEADPVTFDNMARAIGAFERKLVTPGRWDKYLAGDVKAITAEELAGAKTFVTTGCVSCHMGPAVGGMVYQKLGLAKPWPGLTDKGRGDVVKDPNLNFFFKSPSLRNVAKTAPYLHDGSETDLATMVKKMAEFQLGRQLTDADTASIVAFLNCLTGEAPKDLVAAPALPAGTADTPKPDKT
ncbi:MAG: cytochrome c peroxidase [Kiritimatiellia bacterium]